MKMNSFISDNLWTPAGGLKLESAALEAVKSQVNTLIIAGPGAGKTELLAQRACFLLQTNNSTIPKKILAISFKRDAAENLLERVEKRCGKELAQRFESMTYDAFAKQLLDRFNKAVPEAYRPNRDYNIAEISDIRKAFEISGFQPPRGQKDRDINDRLNSVLINNTLPINNKNVQGDGIIKKAWQVLLTGDIFYDFEPQLSFQMISRLAEYLIRENPLIQRSLQLTYSHIFLDEFQDTTDIQYDLIKTCFLNSDVVVTAVGDSKQRIMLWARAMENIFSEFRKDFAARELKLLMNHRSAPRLVQLQKLFYASLNEMDLDIEASLEWEADDGNAYLHIFSDHLQEAEIISEEIKKLLNDGVKATDICVLVKQLPDTYTDELIGQLGLKGIKARNEGIYQDLLEEECIKICVDTCYLALKDKVPDAWIYIMDILSIVRGFDSKTEIDKILRLQKNLEDFLSELKMQLRQVENKNELKSVIKSIIEYFGVDSIKSVFPRYKRGNYLEKLIEEMVGFLWKEYEETDEWLGALNNLRGLNSVPIMTIHKSKGLEYDTVFFIGLEDAAFWKFSSQPDEDRCAFFVALSRAKRRVDFTFSQRRPTGFNDSQSMQKIEEFYSLLRNSDIVQELNYITGKGWI